MRAKLIALGWFRGPERERKDAPPPPIRALGSLARHDACPWRSLSGVPRFRRVLAAVTAALGALVVASRADAADPDAASLLAQCVTQTDRRPGDVIPVRATDADPLRVTIVEGETLCLRGRLFDDGSGSIVELRIGDAASAKDLPLIMVRLDPPGPMRKLHVRTLGGSLSFDVGWVDDAGAEHPFGHLLSQPGGSDFPASANVHELSLDMPHFASRPTGLDARSAGVTLVLPIGLHVFRSLRGFDDALRASGYAPFARVAPSLGGAMHLEFHRWRLQMLIGDARTRADGPAGSIHADALETHLAGGYDFLRWRGLTGYAMLGFSGEQFRMDARGPNWDYLGNQAGVLGNPDSISRDIWMFTIETGLQQFIPFRPMPTLGLVATLQLGYAQQFSLGSWSATNGGSDHVPGTSDLNLSGPWISLGLGIGYVE